MILGVNDGLVSTFLLVTSVVGGGFDSKEILLTAIAGAIAGAVSMAAGEYIATKSQNQVLDLTTKMEDEINKSDEEHNSFHENLRHQRAMICWNTAPSAIPVVEERCLGDIRSVRRRDKWQTRYVTLRLIRLWLFGTPRGRVSW